MKTIFLTIIICILSVQVSTSQSQFQRTIGGTSEDRAHSIMQTTDGGFVVAGYTTSFGAGNTDMYIVKIDSGGTLQWSKTMGGSGNEWAWSMIQTTDGGFAMVGGTNTFGAGGYDLYIVKLDGSGSFQWSKTVGGSGNEYDHSCIIQTTDGGFVVAGLTTSFGAGGADMFIVKLDINGTLQWSKTVGGTAADYIYSIIQTTDGGYIVAGSTNSFGAGNTDMYIVKIDSGGTLQWSKTMGGSGYDLAYSIIQATDGSYVVAGYTNSVGAGDYDLFIVKLNTGGTLMWSKTIGGTGDDKAQAILQTTDGGYVIAGNTASFGAGSSDFYIVKLDAAGILQSSKTIGGTGNDVAYSIKQTTDGGYIVAGSTNSFGAGNLDMYIVKIDGSGIICGNSFSPTSISGTGGTVDIPPFTTASSTPTIISPTSLISTGGTVTSVCSLVGIQPISNEIPGKFSLSQNYPNPFNPVTKINFNIAKTGFVSLTIFDALGRKVETLVNQEMNAGSYGIDFNGSKFVSGVYFYRLQSADFVDVKKLVLLK
jgi:hypothetical protein